MKKLHEEIIKEFDEIFQNYEMTKFNLNTGDVEQVKSGKTKMVIAERIKLKNFTLSALSRQLDEINKTKISYKELSQRGLTEEAKVGFLTDNRIIKK